ncbi:seven-hairpin glycosidase [Tothia fuscella]|uniref:alpha-1,2-Mannosidase n=1 Tax=Tothia fuscella TaxID=1048955 RepID=A0A9P4NMG4_9PEZI|nr:seven-hairpin glycosidase [Tothia fuscella]
MFRMRRYRVFVLFAAFTVFCIYRFGNPRSWEGPEQLKEHFSSSLGGRTTQARQQQEILDIQKPPPPKNKEGVGKVGPPPKVVVPPPVNVGGGGGLGKDGELKGKVEGDGKGTLSPPPVAAITKPVQKIPPPAKGTESPTPTSEKKEAQKGLEQHGDEDEHDRLRVIPHPPPADAMNTILEQGSGRWENDQLPSDTDTVAIRWEKPEEHFPVSSTIQLPTGTPKPIPRIQYDFSQKKESEAARKDRHEKRDMVKEAFLHAWAGYKEKAWGKDELMPISGGSKNPFNGWGATLVDSLDTLWIMGLQKEFDEAVDWVKDLDFKTSRRADVPIFETTIRYLGGLIGAYDVTDGKYKILLDKAVELAEIMMGAFDTPNRMPDTFYQWKPTFASQPHKASTRVVLAELGSLAVEFTRLAQITKEPKYYDAVARITDALVEWQDHTRLPGMWPTFVDASGCERVVPKSGGLNVQTSVQTLDWKGNPVGVESSNGGNPPISSSQSRRPAELAKGAEKDEGEPGKDGRIKGWDKNHPEVAKGKEPEMVPIKKPAPLIMEAKVSGIKVKRQFDENMLIDPAAKSIPQVNIPAAHLPPPIEVPKEPECMPHGLGSQSQWGTDEFTLGSMSDSTYEYFPKQHILLGGLVSKYRELYEKAIDVAKSRLLFRVMIPNSKREILVSGTLHVAVPSSDDQPITERLAYGGSHLTCFAGGMFAMGAKLFDRKEDLDIAAKLTDGCVWAYESTATGIMPETFVAVPCPDRKNCEWNETLWWDHIDPNPEWREESYESQMKIYTSQLAEQKSLQAEKTKVPAVAKTAVSEAKETAEAGALPAKEKSTTIPDKLKSPSNLEKRQFDDALGSKIAAEIKKEHMVAIPPKRPEGAPAATLPNLAATATAEPESEWVPPTITTDDTPPPLYSPSKPLSHEQLAKQTIEEDRLVPGMKSIGDRRYILRPEALESVFYMHRITGSPYWRTKGWDMIAAVLKHTRTPLGHAAVDDVTKVAPGHEDSMESFWLAETLKYAWLIMEDDELWSLDDWVMNTEAHFLRRGDSKWKGNEVQKKKKAKANEESKVDLKEE